MTPKELNRRCAYFVLGAFLGFIAGCSSLAIAQKPSNANYYELSYKLNTPKAYGKTVDIVGVVVKKHKTSNNGITEHFVTLVSHNTTFRVKVLEKAVYDLIEERQKLVFKNCVIVKLKQ